MNFIKNMPIRGKLVVGFSLMLVIAIFIVVYGAIITLRVDSDYADTLNYSFQQYSLLRDIQSSLLDARRIMNRASMYVGNPARIDEQETAFLQRWEQVNEYLNLYRQSLEADPALDYETTEQRLRRVLLLDRAIHSYFEFFIANGLNASRLGDLNIAIAVAVQNENNADVADLHFEYLFAVTNAHMFSVSEDLSALTSNLIGIQVLMTTVGLIVGILGALFISHTISAPVKTLRALVHNVSEGNLNVNMNRDNLSREEIGLLTKDIYNLVDVIKGINSDVLNFTYQVTTVGDYEYRMNHNKYQGTFNDLVKSINGVTDGADEQGWVIFSALENISKGVFDMEVKQLPGKRAVVNENINEVLNNLRTLNTDLNAMIEAATIKGDLRFRIEEDKYAGDWREIVIGLNRVAKAVNAPILEIRRSIAALNDGSFNPPPVAGRYAGDFLSIKDDFNHYIGEFPVYMKEITDMLSAIANGNLTATITREYVGDFNSIKQSVNVIVARLNETVVDISLVADGVSSGSAQLSRSSMDLSEGVSRQMIAMQEMTEGISLIDVQSKDNSNNAQKAAELALVSKDNAESGNNKMQHLLGAMERITVSSSKISQIIKTIEGIAFQTNLLALNAAVEAARAGEQGRGFGVVAEEVRNLAARSAEAAKQTSELIQESIASVQDGKKSATDTAESLGKIVQNVLDVSDVINEIFESSNNQTGAIGSINDDLLQINNVVQGSAATSEETAAAAEELDSQVAILKDKLSFFSTNLSNLSVKKVWDTTTSDKLNSANLRNIPGEHKRFENGQSIVKEGDENADTMYFVLEGNVKVIKSYDTLNEKILANLKAGDLFGEMALFLKEPRTADVIASGNATVVEVHRNTLTQFMEASPETAYVIIETLCTRLKNVLADFESY